MNTLKQAFQTVNAIATQTVNYSHAFYLNEVASGLLMSDIKASLAAWDKALDAWQQWSDELRADLWVVASAFFTVLSAASAVAGKFAGRAYRYWKNRGQAQAVAGASATLAAVKSLPEVHKPALQVYHRIWVEVKAIFLVLLSLTVLVIRFVWIGQLGEWSWSQVRSL